MIPFSFIFHSFYDSFDCNSGSNSLKISGMPGTGLTILRNRNRATSKLNPVRIKRARASHQIKMFSRGIFRGEIFRGGGGWKLRGHCCKRHLHEHPESSPSDLTLHGFGDLNYAQSKGY